MKCKSDGVLVWIVYVVVVLILEWRGCYYENWIWLLVVGFGYYVYYKMCIDF